MGPGFRDSPGIHHVRVNTSSNLLFDGVADGVVQHMFTSNLKRNDLRSVGPWFGDPLDTHHVRASVPRGHSVDMATTTDARAVLEHCLPTSQHVVGSHSNPSTASDNTGRINAVDIDEENTVDSRRLHASTLAAYHCLFQTAALLPSLQESSREPRNTDTDNALGISEEALGITGIYPKVTSVLSVTDAGPPLRLSEAVDHLQL